MCGIWLQISRRTSDGTRPSLERAEKVEKQRSPRALVYQGLPNRCHRCRARGLPGGRGSPRDTAGSQDPTPQQAASKGLSEEASLSVSCTGGRAKPGLCEGRTRRPAPLARQSPPAAEGAGGPQAAETRRAPLTVVHAAAEATLVPPPSFDELHERAHVGFAPVASDWSSLPMVYQVEGRLEEASRSKRHVGTAFPGFLRSPTAVVTEM